MSVFPPKNPDRSPTAPPITIATRAAANPTISDTREPTMISDSMSAPESSVPRRCAADGGAYTARSEEHTSELQSLRHLVCRLLLEKKNDIERAQSPHPNNGNNRSEDEIDRNP